MKTVLVTGASGFVGTHLVKYFEDWDKLQHKSVDLKVIAVVHDDVVWTKWLEESLGGTVRVKGDVRDKRFIMRVLNQYEVTDVVHLAAQSIVKRAYKDPMNTFDINIMGTVSMLEACRLVNVPGSIVVQSTDKVYGNCENATTESALRPTEPYSGSKIAADIIAQTYRETYNMDVFVTRPCNIYGYDPDNNRIIPNTVKKCLAGESPVIFKNEETKRQYVYVDDVSQIMLQLITVQNPRFSFKDPILNIASPTVLTQAEVVRTILQFFPKLEPILEDKPGLKEIHSQSMEFYHSACTPTEFTEGIRRTIEQFKYYGF